MGISEPRYGRVIGCKGAEENVEFTRQAYSDLASHYIHLYQMAPLSVIMFDLDGCIQEVNFAACDLFRCDRRSLIGKSFFTLLPPAMHKVFVRHIQESASDNRSHVCELDIRKLDGGEARVHFVSRAVTTMEPGKPAVQCAIFDTSTFVPPVDMIPPPAESTSPLVNVQSAGTAVSTALIRDFGNIFMSIMGHIHMASNDLPEASSARKNIFDVATLIKDAANLYRQIILQAGADTPILRRISLSRLIQESSGFLELTATQCGRIVFELEEKIPDVEADEVQIRQALINLVANAADAVQDTKNATIRISTGMQVYVPSTMGVSSFGEEFAEGTYAFVQVSDNGCGIHEEDIERIFDPLFSTKHRGKGLGLPAVLNIMRSHQGVILVESKVDHGTTVALLFPVAASAQESITTVADVERPKTVLVVDDEPVVRAVTSRILEKAGFHVLTAEDGVEAMKIFGGSHDQIDLVLLDMTMPNMNGDETLIRMNAIRDDIPVILSSGYTQDDTTHTLANASYAAFIEKPYQSKQLLAVIRDVIGRLPVHHRS